MVGRKYAAAVELAASEGGAASGSRHGVRAPTRFRLYPRRLAVVVGANGAEGGRAARFHGQRRRARGVVETPAPSLRLFQTGIRASNEPAVGCDSRSLDHAN